MILYYFKRGALIALLFTFSFTSVSAGPLHEAAKKGNTTQVKRLLAKGADLNARTRDGFTALHWAASNGKTKTVKLLLAKGANVNAKNNYGETALHWAAYIGNTKTVKLLLAKGADVNAKDNKGRTVLYWTLPKKRIKKILQKHGAKY